MFYHISDFINFLLEFPMIKMVTMLFCLAIIFHTQSSIIRREASDYTLKVENLGTHLHFEVLYKIEAGVRRCERDVDEGYIERNLPFIANMEMLFSILVNE